MNAHQAITMPPVVQSTRRRLAVLTASWSWRNRCTHSRASTGSHGSSCQVDRSSAYMPSSAASCGDNVGGNCVSQPRNCRGVNTATRRGGFAIVMVRASSTTTQGIALTAKPAASDSSVEARSAAASASSMCGWFSSPAVKPWLRTQTSRPA